MNTQNSNPYILPVAVVVAGVLIAVAVMFGPQNSGVKNDVADKGPVPGQRPAAPSVDAKKVDIKGDPFVGKVDAPLTVVYWSDYQCPFCKKFDIETLGEVVKNYVDKGKVKVVFQDFQFLSKDSFTLAVVGRAVWEAYPEKYFDWREAMFKNQGQEHSGYATEEYIKRVTTSVPGIDMSKIQSLIDKNNDAYMAAIEADKAEAAKYGVNGTPGIIAGKRLISGHVSYPSFSAALDAELK